jgi:hypothetical protein
MEKVELTEKAKDYLELHRVVWVLVNGKHPNFNQWACYNKDGEFLYNEDFPKHIDPNKTYPCGQHTITGLIPDEDRDVAYATAPVEREGFRH